MLEDFEDVIEKWYLDGGDLDNTPLLEYLCDRHVLKKSESSCLREKGDTGENTAYREADSKTKTSSERKKTSKHQESSPIKSQPSTEKDEL